MSLHQMISAIIALFLSFCTFAYTAVAPENRIRIWDGPYSLNDTNYSIGTNSHLGTVKTLKTSASVTSMIYYINYVSNTGGMDMSGKYLSGANFSGTLYQRLSESGFQYTGQCVAFAKAMTGVGGSYTWYRGRGIMSYLTPNALGYSPNNLLPSMAPGTMIAHFGSISTNSAYSTNAVDPHVAIFLSWSYNNYGYIDGMNVVDQNLVWSVSGISGTTSGLIQKHKIPLSSSSTNKTYSSKNYHVVDVRWGKQKPKHIIATLSRLIPECEKRGA
jgi:hypothetical protein